MSWVCSTRAAEGKNNPADRAKAEPPKTNPAAQMAGAALMELAVAVILMVFTFRSTDRGQVAFALAASFFVAALTAHYIFPVRCSLPFCVGPIFMGLVVFVLGTIGAGGAPGPAWHNALVVARSLELRAAMPVDWLCLGCGGAVAGFWLSRRLRYGRMLREKAAKEAESG